MAVKTRESMPTKLYTLYDMDENERVYTYRQWQSLIGTKSDFVYSYIIAGAAKSRPNLSYEQKATSSRKLLLDRERTLWKPIIIRYVETIPVQEIVEEVDESAVAAPPIEIVYENQKLVEALLGNEGKVVLEKVISLIEDSVRRDNWPLTKVVVHYVKDFEVDDWQYALVVLLFNSDLDNAEGYLRDFYNKLDILTERFSDQEQGILERLLYFDVGTNISEA